MKSNQYSPKFVTVVIPRMVVRVPIFRLNENAPERLSPAQLRVFNELVTGKSAKEVAVAVNSTVRTVKEHITRIYRKAGVSGRGELLAIYGRKAT